MRTLGGKQFWADHRILGGWRVQEHVYSGNYRLLDARDHRRCAGTREECEAALERAAAAGEARWESRRFVLLLHGFIRSKDSLRRLAAHLQQQGFEACPINMPSLQWPLVRFGEQAAGILRYCAPAFDEVHLVTHSMGGIVARLALDLYRPANLARLVQIAPPNQGAHLAARLTAPFQGSARFPGALFDLAAGETWSAAGIPPPPCEFGVIAGCRGNDSGFNPLLNGDDDGLVAVEETKLPEMSDFACVRGFHTFLMNKPEVLDQVTCFLNKGRFRADHTQSEQISRQK